MENTIDTDSLITKSDRLSRWLWLWNQVDTDNPMTWQEVASLQGGNANGSGSHGESHDRRGEQEQSEEVQEISEDREVSNQPQPIATPARTVTAVPSESAAADVQDPGSSEFLQENPTVDRETLTTRECRQPLSVAGCLRWLRGLDWLGTPVPVHDTRSEEDDQLEQANGGWSHGESSDRRGEQKESEEVHGISDGQEESNHRQRAIPEPSAAFAPTATVVPSESAAACDQDLGRNEVQENRVNPHSPTTGEGRKWLSDEEWSRRIAWLGPRPIQIHTLEEQQIEPKELQERDAGQSNHPRRAVPVPEPSRPIATPGPTATATYFPPGFTAAGVENPGSSVPQEDPVDPETLPGSMGRQWLLIKDWLRWLRRLDGSETPIEDHETREEQLIRSEEVQEASEGQSNRPRRAVPSEPSQPIAMPGPTANAVPPESTASGIENPGSYEYQKNRANLHTIITKEGHSSSTDNEKWTKRLRWLALGNPVQVHTLEEERIRSEELQEMSEGQSNYPGRTAAEPSQVNATPGPAATTTYVPDQESAAAGVEDPGRSELQENPVDPDTFTSREFEQSLRTAGWVHRLWLWDWLGTPVDPPVQVQTSDEQRRLEEFEEQERLRKGKMPKVDSDSD